MKASLRTGGTAQDPAATESAAALGEGVPAGHEGCGQRCWRDVREAWEPRDGARFRILFVCTGNICRSPLAERLTRSALGDCPAIQVASAGTRAWPGLEMDRRAMRALVRLGGDPEDFGSRRLTSALVADADLVLTATRGHRAESVAMHLAAAPRTFTIAEFGVLTEAVRPSKVIRHRDPARRARALVDEARALRGVVPVDESDIIDPYGGSWLRYRAMGRSIARSLATPLRLLTHSPDA
ncbi:arsenate reductase/protein-tyrosine-phosphatase family protein [Streptosporangium vulgare]|uniref:Phosphotyrosine protein phosphatase I domain-containing protein n=1 Tax=Streptosporangium vulgare TaxID=46190 RepID=A0ABV5TW61_9ACTN